MLLAFAVVGLTPTWGAAHVDTDPAEAAAGEPVTVQFMIKHGCEDFPTVKVAFAVPAGVTAMSGVAKPGWTIETTNRVVTFQGGELDAHTLDHFDLTFTAPTKTGPLPFPMIQTCAKGELTWISVALPGREEPDYPAPIVQVNPSSGATSNSSAASATSLRSSPSPSVSPAATTNTTNTSADSIASTPSAPSPILPDNGGGGQGWLPPLLAVGLGLGGAAAALAGLKLSRRLR